MEIIDDQNVLKDLTTSDIQNYRTHLDKLLHQRRQELLVQNQIQLNELPTDLNGKPFINTRTIKTKIYPYQNHDERVMALEENMKKLNALQTDALNKIFDYISSEDPNCQLRMFATGEGGTGKSEIIKIATEFGKLYFGRQEGNYGPVLVMAQTGTASTNIDGFTWHSVFSKFNNDKKKISNNTARKVGQKLKGVKLLILDEISLTSFENLYEIHERIVESLLSVIATNETELRQQISNKPFGGIHILFSGDLYQLACFNGTPLYQPESLISKDVNSKARKGFMLWNQLTHFVELTENMRMQTATTEDKEFVKICSSVRKGVVEDRHLHLLNKRLCIGAKSAAKAAPDNAIWVANTNNEVDLLNKQEFNDLRAKGKFSVRIVAQHKPSSISIPMPTTNQSKVLFSKTSNRSKAFKTPTYIDLAIGSTVMLNRNLGTEIGLVNGSIGKVVGFGFSKNDPPNENCELPLESNFHMIKPSAESPIVFVKFPGIKSSSTENELDENNIIPITLQQTQEAIKVENIRYYRWQLPLTPAAAITTHKAQGYTARNGIIYSPSKKKPFCRGLE